MNTTITDHVYYLLGRQQAIGFELLVEDIALRRFALNCIYGPTRNCYICCYVELYLTIKSKLAQLLNYDIT